MLVQCRSLSASQSGKALMTGYDAWSIAPGPVARDPRRRPDGVLFMSYSMGLTSHRGCDVETVRRVSCVPRVGLLLRVGLGGFTVEWVERFGVIEGKNAS